MDVRSMIVTSGLAMIIILVFQPYGIVWECLRAGKPFIISRKDVMKNANDHNIDKSEQLCLRCFRELWSLRGVVLSGAECVSSVNFPADKEILDKMVTDYN